MEQQPDHYSTDDIMSLTNEHRSVWDCIPPEVRNRIYEECASPQRVCFWMVTLYTMNVGPIEALRRTSRTIYREIAGYERATTSLSIKAMLMRDNKDLESLMRSFRGAYKNIKHVTLRSDMPLPRGLEELPSLATVPSSELRQSGCHQPPVSSLPTIADWCSWHTVTLIELSID